jgi:hypothetical protein
LVIILGHRLPSGALTGSHSHASGLLRGSVGLLSMAGFWNNHCIHILGCVEIHFAHIIEFGKARDLALSAKLGSQRLHDSIPTVPETGIEAVK